MLNKKNIAKAIIASILAMNVYGVAFAAPGGGSGGNSGSTTTDTRQNIKVEVSTDADGIKNPDLNHTHFGNGEHNNVCGENVDNTDLTIGKINTVVDNLVANDKKLMSDIKNEVQERKDADAAEAKVRESADNALDKKIDREILDRRNADNMLSDRLMDETKNRMADDAQERSDRMANDIVSGSAADGKITLVKGDQSTIDIEVDGLGSDTYVDGASYDGDDQKLTLKRNDGTDIDVTLDNVAKASDLNDLDTKVGNIENNVNNIDNRVGAIEGDINTINNNINNIDNRVGDVENTVNNVKNDINVIKGETITNATFADNELTLKKDNGSTITVDGIASVDDLNAEAKARADKDKELDQRLQNETFERVEQQRRLDQKIDDESAAREKGDKELDAKLSAETDARLAEDAKLDQKINDESVARAAADDKLAGMDIASGKMDGNTLVLDRYNEDQIKIDGVANAKDVEKVKEEVKNNTEKIEKETNERKSEDERLDGRIDGVQQDISDLNGRINKLDGKINKGVASAIAIASLKPLDYDANYKWTYSMGVGNYHGENAIAAGAFYQPNADLLLNVSFSICGNEKAMGAGVSVRFK